MQKIYLVAKDSTLVQELCLGSSGALAAVYWWALPDGSGEVVVCEPRNHSARSALQAMSAQGVTVLPGPHSTASFTAEQRQLFSSLNLPPTATTAEPIYEHIAKQSGLDIFSPHT